MVDYKSIGRRIALNRKNIKMTQATLAERLDVSESFVSQIERGNAKISLSRLYQVADILNIDIAILVSDGNMLADSGVPSEIEQIIKDWSAEKRSLLIELIICANEKMKSI